MITNKSACLKAVLLLTFCGLALCQVEEICTNPFGQRGTCIKLTTCSNIVRFLQSQSRPVSVRTRDLLRRYQCGFEGKTPKVCCSPLPREYDGGNSINNGGGNQGNNGNQGGSVISRYEETAPPPPPSVERHRNLHLLPTDCGALDDDRLFGGNKTGLYEFPWMALISYNSSRALSFRCGGTIINERYILTAAHCLKNLGALSIAGVRVGEHDVSTEKDCDGPPNMRICAPAVQDFGVKEIIVHPDYDGTRDRFRKFKFQNDIGLIKIDGVIDFQKANVLAICLPTTKRLQEFNLEDQNLVVAGWGATENGPSSPDLLKINVPVVSNRRCAEIHNRSTADGVGFRQMCAGGVTGVDSCGGDSGGPLKLPGPVGNTFSYVQHGIVSYGPKNCGTPGTPAVYTRVAYYMDWILDQLKSQ